MQFNQGRDALSRKENTAMKKQTIEEDAGSRVVWDNLEEWARSLIQGVI